MKVLCMVKKNHKQNQKKQIQGEKVLTTHITKSPNSLNNTSYDLINKSNC